MVNTPLISDGQPWEPTTEEAAPDYEKISPSLGSTIGAEVEQYNPMFQLGRMAERGAQTGSSFFDQEYNSLAGLGGTQPSPNIDPKEAKEKYGVDTGKPIPEGLVKVMGKQKEDQINRESIIDRYENTHDWPTNFAVGTAAFLLDPLNDATMLIPGVGEEAVAARFGEGLLARVGTRAVGGATAGAIGQVPLTALRYGASKEEQTDYGIREAARDLVYGAAGGAFLGATAGTALGEGVRGLKTLKDRYYTSNPEVNHAAMSSAISQVLDGRPVDVEPIFNADPLNQATELVEGINRQMAKNYAPELMNQYDILRNRQNEIKNQLFNTDQYIANHPEVTPIQDKIDSLLDRQEKNGRLGAKEQEKLKNLYTYLYKIEEKINPNKEKLKEEYEENYRQINELQPDVNMAFKISAFLNDKETPANIAQRQSELYKKGYDPGLSQKELTETKEEIFPKEPPKKGPITEIQYASGEKKILQPGEQWKIDPELEQLETHLNDTENPIELTPEEKEELKTTDKFIRRGSQAQATGEGYYSTSGIQEKIDKIKNRLKEKYGQFPETFEEQKKLFSKRDLYQYNKAYIKEIDEQNRFDEKFGKHNLANENEDQFAPRINTSWIMAKDALTEFGTEYPKITNKIQKVLKFIEDSEKEGWNTHKINQLTILEKDVDESIDAFDLANRGTKELSLDQVADTIESAKLTRYEVAQKYPSVAEKFKDLVDYSLEVKGQWDQNKINHLTSLEKAVDDQIALIEKNQEKPDSNIVELKNWRKSSQQQFKPFGKRGLGDTEELDRSNSIELEPGTILHLVKNPTIGEQRLLEQVASIANKIVPDAHIIATRYIDTGPATRASAGITPTGQSSGLTFIQGARNLIAWSLRSPNPSQTIRHEAIHWLRANGFFTGTEWKALRKASADYGWQDQFNIENRYPNAPTWLKEEESIAEAHAYSKSHLDWIPESVRPIFSKLEDLLNQVRDHIKRLFGADISAQDIFSRISSGEISRRGPQTGGAIEYNRGEEPLSYTQEQSELGKEPTEEEVQQHIAAMNKRKDIIRNALIRNTRVKEIDNIEKAANTVSSWLHFVPSANNNNSIESMWHGLSKAWRATVGTQLRLDGLEKAALSGQLDEQIANAWGKLNGWDINSKIEISKPAQQIAEIFHSAAELAKNRLNGAGAHIGDALDYVTHTRWDPRQLRTAAGKGRSRDEAFEAWRAKDEPRMSPRTFEHIEPEEGETEEQARTRFLRSVWDARTSGVSITRTDLSDDGNGYIPIAYEGTYNVARRVGQQRTIFWKDASSWYAHMKDFGGGQSLYSALDHTLEQSSRQTALMTKLGTNPEGNLNAIIQKIKERYRDTDGLKAFEAKIPSFLTKLSYLDGTANIPTRETRAAWEQTVLNLEVSSRAGGIAIPHLTSAPMTISSELVHHGASRLDAFGNILKAITSGRGSEEVQQALADAGAYANGYNLALRSYSQTGQGIPGYISWRLTQFMKLTTLPHFLDQLQAQAVKSVIMQGLGRDLGKTLDQLHPSQQAVMQRYGLGSDEWNLLRNTTDHIVDSGRTLLSPDAANRISDQDTVELLEDRKVINEESTPEQVNYAVQKFKWELGDKYLMYLNDASERSTITPGIREQAAVLGNSRPGDDYHERFLRRSLAQFKMWPLAAWNQIINREIAFSLSTGKMAANFGWILALSTAAGAARLAINDMINGRPQRDYTRGDNLLTALGEGGGLGIYGDVFFGALSKSSNYGLGDTLGPVYSDFETLLKSYNQFRNDLNSDQPDRQDDVGWNKAFKHALPEAMRFGLQHIPASNLFYLKGAIDYMAFYHMYEAASPGWWERTNQRMEKEQGQTMLGYSPGEPIPYGIPGIYLTGQQQGQQ